MFLIYLFLPSLVQAVPNLGLIYAENLGLATTDEDPRDVLANVVSYLLTFIGIIAVVIVLLGGLKWMTSMGNEDRLASAKATVMSGLIGLVFIIISYAIVTLIIDTTTNVIQEGTII